MASGEPLDRLNASERELLLLLGSGHTAKSIAALKGLSELAVNERFRSARRKTGIGSSREIARLLVAQENRDDFIGLAEPAASPPDLPRPDAQHRASFLRRWSLPMSAAALLIASAILAQQTSVPPVRPVPPGAAAIFNREPAPDLAALHAEVSSGRPDPAWSPGAEAALANTFHDLPGFVDAIDSFSVTCSASLCEAVGVMQAGLSVDQVNQVTSGIQGPLVREAATGLGLQTIGTGFSSTRNETVGPASEASVFAAYWRRRSE